MTEGEGFSPEEIRRAVRQRYAQAIGAGGGCGGGPAPGSPVQAAGSCCGPAPSPPVQIAGPGGGPAPTPARQGGMAALAGYAAAALDRLPADAVQHSFGCGNPLAYAEVRPGHVVLDIGSGAGIDCLIAAERVGPTGRVIGLDMTPEMIERARQNVQEAAVATVEFRLGDAERMPVEDGAVDWVISNCVINLSPDKPAVFREIARVLKPGGRIAISDIVAEDLPEALRRSRDAWTGCLAGAIGEAEYGAGLAAAGLRGVRVTSRLVYEASQLVGLFASSCCGVGDASAEVGALAAAAAGKIWSARFEGVKPAPASVAAAVAVEPARPEDLPAMHALLREGELPVDVERHLDNFLVARHGERVAGCIGMEVCGADALFRSLAVTAAYRGLGLATRLHERLAARARARGIRQAYLLTRTVQPLAARWGFVPVDRAEVPEAIRATSEFAGSCCAAAVAMRRGL